MPPSEQAEGNEGDFGDDMESQIQPLLGTQRNFGNQPTSYESINTDAQDLGPDTAEEMPKPNYRQMFIGFTCTIVAGLSFTVGNTMVKLLPSGNSWQILFLRSLLQGLCMLPLVIRSGSGILGSDDIKTRWRVVISGGLGAFLLLAVFESVERIPLGDCTAIFFSGPGITMILSLFILREHCGIWRVLIAISALVGVVIVCRPPALFTGNSLPDDEELIEPGSSIDLAGLLWGISCPIVGAVMDILTRQASHVHFSVFVLWFGLGGLCISTGGIAYEGVTPFQDWQTNQWLLGVGASMVGIIGRILFTVALSYITPNQVHVILCLEVVFAYILQVVVFDDPILWTSVAGTITILAACLAMIFEGKVRERVQSRFI